VFLVQRGLGVGIALYAPAVVLSVIMGWPEWLTIMTMGVLVVSYTVIGGIKAVMWTDAQQMLVMFLGIFVAFFSAIWGLPSDVSFSDALYLSGVSGKLRAVDLSFDWENRYNIWSGLIGGTFLALSYFGCDQSQVQRYLTGKSIAHMRFSLLFNAVVKVPLQFLILLTGAMVFTFFLFEQSPVLFNNVQLTRMQQSGDPAYQAVEQRYQQALSARRNAALRLLDSNDPAAETTYLAAERTVQTVRREGIALAEKASGATYNDTNYIFLHFVTRHLPVGLVGLIMAAVFAAAMSTISAELNSLATVTVIDHYRRYLRPNAEDRHYAKVSMGATAFWGIYATVFASYGGQLGSLIEAVNIVGSWFYGSVLGVFVLAFAPWRANGTGAFTGLLAGLAAVAWTDQNTSISFLWFNVVGCVVTVTVGLVASRAAGATQRASSR
jgi:Na+/proline symporter